MDDKSTRKVFRRRGESRHVNFAVPDPFEITVTNPCRREDALHMDDGARTLRPLFGLNL